MANVKWEGKNVQWEMLNGLSDVRTKQGRRAGVGRVRREGNVQY